MDLKHQGTSTPNRDQQLSQYTAKTDPPPKKKMKYTVHDNLNKLMTPDWINQRNKGSAMNLRDNGTVVYPFWKIVSNKNIKVQYNFTTQRIFVVFEHEGHTCLKLHLAEWAKLKSAVKIVVEFSESFKNDPEEAKLILHDVKEISVKGEIWNFSRIIYDYCHALEIRWKTGGNCLVDMVYGLCDASTDYEWSPSKRANMLLSLMGFVYFGSILLPFVDAGIEMWRNMMSEALTWENLSPAYEDDSDIPSVNWK